MATDSIRDLQGNMKALTSRPKSLESDQAEFKRFHPDKVWKRDGDVSACAQCRAGFGMTRRKHHCRECGDVFCNDCSSRQIVVHGTLKRCCVGCYGRAVFDAKRPNYPGSGGPDDEEGDFSGSAKGPQVDPSTWSSAHSFAKASFMANSMASSPARGAAKKDEGAQEGVKPKSEQGAAASGAGTGSGTGKATRSSALKTDDSDAFRFPPWVDVVVYIREENTRNSGSVGTQRAFVCHPLHVLPLHMLQDICDTAVPHSGAKHGAAALETSDAAENFMFRVRDRSNGGLAAVSDAPSEDVDSAPAADADTSGRSDVTSGTLFYNCYASYRESYHESPNGYSSSSTTVRHAVVVVSRWPFPLLAFYALYKLDEALNWSRLCVDEDASKPASSSPMSLSSVAGKASSATNSPTKPATSTSVQVISDRKLQSDFQRLIENVIAVGFNQLLAFPEPKLGQTMSCPFLGETLHYNPPIDLKPTYGQNMSLAASANAVNLVSKLTPLGLLNHIWELWELVATGKDILVISESAAHSSELVLALASLLVPLGYNGDCRPFMQARDKDVLMLRRMSLQKQQERRDMENKAKDGAVVSNVTARNFRNSSMIVGATDPKMLKILKNFDVCILLGPLLPSDLPQTAQAMRDQVRQRNAAAFRIVSDDASFEDIYKTWKDDIQRGPAVAPAANANGPSDQKTLLLYRSSLQTTMDRDVVRTIQNMDSLTSMRVLGDKLVRDRLSAMTVAFFKPIDSGISLEVAEMRSAALERAQIAEERRQVSKLKEAIQQDCDSGLLDIQNTIRQLKQLPATLPYIVPTLIMWFFYLIGGSIYTFFGFPLPPLLCLILIGVFPEQAPKKFERVLRLFVPLWVLYPLVFDAQGRRKDGRDGRRRSTEDSWERTPSNTPVNDDGASTKGRKKVTINEGENDDIDEAASDADDAEEGEGASSSSASTGDAMPLAPGKYSGVWKRNKTVDYDKFLIAQGAGWMKARLGASISLEHIITMDEGGRFFRLMERGGPVKTDHTYTVDGVTVDETVISEARFKDTCSWDNGILYIHKKAQPDEKYELRVHRYMDDDTHLRIVAQYINFSAPDKNVTATSYFEKTGPTPAEYVKEMAARVAASPAAAGAAPAAAGAASAASSTASADADSENPDAPVAVGVSATSPASLVPNALAKNAPNTVDFSGCWLRNRNANYDAILFALGMTHAQRRSALANRMMLTIKMSADKQSLTVTETMTAERSVRESERSSSSDFSTSVAERTQEVTYTINVTSELNQPAPGSTEILGHRYVETATFVPSRVGGGVLRIRQVRDDNACESIVELSLMPALNTGELELCMCNTFRDLKNTRKEPVEAVQVFCRMSEDDINAWQARFKPRASTSQGDASNAGQATSGAPASDAVVDLRKLLHGSWQRDQDAGSDTASQKVVHTLALTRDLGSITIKEKVGEGATASHLYKIGDTDEATAPRSTVQGRVYIEKLEWDNESLVLKKKSVDGQTVIVTRRTVVAKGPDNVRSKEYLRVDSSTVQVQSGEKTSSTATFQRI